MNAIVIVIGIMCIYCCVLVMSSATCAVCYVLYAGHIVSCGAFTYD